MSQLKSELSIEIQEESLSRLAEHARVSIAFTVDRVFDVAPDDASPGGFRLAERRLPTPYVKDYDAIAGNHPTDWWRVFDLSTWGWIAAYRAGRRIGGAMIACRASGLPILAGRSDVAAIWDLRVAPEERRRGVASALFAAVERWAVARGCR